MLNDIKRIVRLIDDAEVIFKSTADWAIKYDLIFNLGIVEKARKIGFTIEWCDPDTTYKADITAYFEALMDFKTKLGDLKPVP